MSENNYISSQKLIDILVYINLIIFMFLIYVLIIFKHDSSL